MLPYLPTVILRPFHYRGMEIIGLDLQLDNSLEKEVRKLKGIKWCGEKGYWYMPLNKESYCKIRLHLEGRAILNTTQLRRYLSKRRTLTLSA